MLTTVFFSYQEKYIIENSTKNAHRIGAFLAPEKTRAKHS
jgi:hypothetical protein